MCTAILINAGDTYFGRNLDYEVSFGEKVTITPRNYKFKFRNGKEMDNHFAVIGMAIVKKDYPLYFDATNEAGLSIAGLRFAGNTVYNEKQNGKDNVASFEFIPYILAKCKDVNDAEKMIKNINITDESFDEELKPSPLHWIVADKKRSIVVEQTKDGLKIYENPLGVLTNNPSFDMQMANLSNYMKLSADEPKNDFAKDVCLPILSRGMGAIGLPGDMSSMSRFVKTAFLCSNAVFDGGEEEKVNQFFHILYSVYQIRGTVRVGGDFEITHYTSCCNADKGIYYYTTYKENGILKASFDSKNVCGDKVIVFK